MNRLQILRHLQAVLLLVVSVNLGAQNLVKNPSFENVETSSLKCTFYAFPTDFNSAIYDWTCPTIGSSDIYVSGLPNSCVCSPSSTNPGSLGQQAPRTGSVMTGCILLSDTCYREYVQGSLTAPLIAGTNYKIGFYVSLGDNAKIGCNNIGIKFSTSPVSVLNNCVYAVTPDANYSGSPITDASGWTKLEFCYTPSASGLQYFMIGNFLRSVATLTATANAASVYNYSYYFIDDVSIIPNVLTPTLSLAANCSSTTTTLSVLPASVNYTWTAPPGASILSGANGQEALVQGPGIFTITVQDPGACTNTARTTVFVPIAGTPDLSTADLAICSGQATSLSAGSTLPGGTYHWLPGGESSPTISVSPSTSTSYTVSYTLNGCKATAVAHVTVTTSPTVSIDSLSICEGETGTLTAIASPAGGTYLWQPGGETSSSISVTPAVTSSYNVLYSLNGCTASAVAHVQVHAQPALMVSASQDTILPFDPVIITATGGGICVWNTGSTSSVIDVAPGLSTTYCATLTAAGGCRDVACLDIVVLNDSKLEIPNVFTPNGDGINDVFHTRNMNIKSYSLNIFNRWGTPVFKTENKNQGWDGSWNGNIMPDGTYLFLLEAEGTDGVIYHKTGHITLIH